MDIYLWSLLKAKGRCHAQKWSVFFLNSIPRRSFHHLWADYLLKYMPLAMDIGLHAFIIIFLNV